MAGWRSFANCVLLAAARASSCKQRHLKQREVELHSKACWLRSRGHAGEGDRERSSIKIAIHSTNKPNQKGACKADIKGFCADVSPGEGRVVACLSKRLRMQKQGNTAGRAVSDKCVADLVAFKIDRSTNINKDLALGEFVVLFCLWSGCGGGWGGRQHVLLFCARRRRAAARRSTPARTQQPNSLLLLPPRTQSQQPTPPQTKHNKTKTNPARACKDDVLKLPCKDQSDAKSPGAVVGCLRDNRASKLSPKCEQEVFRTQMEAAEDYRYDAALHGHADPAACELTTVA